MPVAAANTDDFGWDSDDSDGEMNNNNATNVITRNTIRRQSIFEDEESFNEELGEWERRLNPFFDSGEEEDSEEEEEEDDDDEDDEEEEDEDLLAPAEEDTDESDDDSLIMGGRAQARNSRTPQERLAFHTQLLTRVLQPLQDNNSVRRSANRVHPTDLLSSATRRRLARSNRNQPYPKLELNGSIRVKDLVTVTAYLLPGPNLPSHESLSFLRPGVVLTGTQVWEFLMMDWKLNCF